MEILMKCINICILLIGSCTIANSQNNVVKERVSHVQQQLNLFLENIPQNDECPNPVHIKTDGTTKFCSYSDWRSGFFPGTLWLTYELTGKSYFFDWAKKYTESIRKAEKITNNHDIGFIIMCSFGNGLRITNDSTYTNTIITAAKSLSTRFRPAANIIQSWDVSSGWMSKRGWDCPVIIDNMMNLELLFKATALSGDSTYYNIAVKHADRTLNEHFRNDGSCYHVVDYNQQTGEVRSRVTAQGYSDESIWSRGQAWAIYGFTVCYRETGDKRYLNQALKTFLLMKNHTAMPKDLIPYWDMSVPDIKNQPRDVSSASCIASALYELSTMGIKESKECKEYADKIMQSLSSSTYLAEIGDNNYFLLMHSVGSIPHKAEVDVPLNYADYYYMEALQRKNSIENKK